MRSFVRLPNVTAMFCHIALKILLYLVMGGLVATVRQPPGLGNRTQFVYIRDGDVSIGHMVSIHTMDDKQQCTKLIPLEVLRSKAVEFAIDQINKREDLLPNITVGFVQLDDCFNDLKALEVAIYLINNELDDGRQLNNSYQRPTTDSNTLYSTMVGVLGLLTSFTSISVSQYLGTFHVPVMSVLATVNELSDKMKYPYFMRLVPPDINEARVMIEVGNFI